MLVFRNEMDAKLTQIGNENMEGRKVILSPGMQSKPVQQGKQSSPFK